MKKRLLIVPWLILSFALFAAPGYADLLEPMTCTQSASQALIDMAPAGAHTLRLPACSPVNWTTTLISREDQSIMLEGQTCSVGDSGKTDASGRPITIATSCPTQIVDAITSSDQLIRFFVPPCTHPCSHQVGMRHLSITSTGQRGAGNNVFGFNGSGAISEDGRRVKLEYLRIVGIVGSAALLFRISEWGVAAHLYIETPLNVRQIVFYHVQGGSSYSTTRADQRLTNSTVFGGEDAWTIENSVFIVTCTVNPTGTPFTDMSFAGGRVVVRNNYLEGGQVNSHGVEGGFAHGSNYMEVFGNKFHPCVAGADPGMLESRSGGVITWNNVMSGAFPASTPAAFLKTYRMLGQAAAYNEVNGHTAVDQNDPGNPLVSCTTTANVNNVSDSMVTVDVVNCTGDNSWSTNEHRGKIIHQPWPACRERNNFSCGATINSNTSNTLTYRPNLFDIENRANPGAWPGSATLNLAAGGGDTIHIDGVISTLHQPCRAGGTVFGATGTVESITMSGAVATLTAYQTMATLGISTSDYVTIDHEYFVETSDYNNKPYRGTYQVTVTGATTLTYSPWRVPTGPVGAGGVLKKVLSNSSIQTSNCYEFLNFNDSLNAIHFSTNVPTGGGSKFMDLPVSGVDANPVVFEYVGTSTTVGRQTSASAPFNGTVGVGVGTIAFRPATCTTGVFYWAENEGEWDSTNGATPDGNGYKCTATNTWTLTYTPLAFPHPLTASVGSITSVTPAAGIQGDNLNNVAFVGVGFQCAGFSVPTFNGLTITDVVVASDTSMRWDIAIAGGATVGARSLYFNCTAGASTGTTFTVNASADTTAPTAGGGGTLTGTGATSTSLSITWTKGADNVSAQSALQYEMRRSSTNNMGTVANAEANGTICQNYTTDVATASCSNLTAATTYWLQVLLRDEAGNKNIYTQTSFTTDTDPNQPPTPGGQGIIDITNVTSSSVVLNFVFGSDDDTPQNLLEYSAWRSLSANINSVANIETNGTLVFSYATLFSPIINVGNLTPSTIYFFNIIVRDGNGNKAAYTQKNAAGNASRARLR